MVPSYLGAFAGERESEVVIVSNNPFNGVMTETKKIGVLSCGKCGGIDIGWFHEKGSDYLFRACVTCEDKLPEDKRAIRWFSVTM